MALDLLFPDRAVRAFVAAANENKVGPRQVRDVIKYEKVDVAPIEPFLKSDDAWVRQCAAQVIAARGKNMRLLVDAAKIEQDKTVLLVMIEGLAKQKEGLEEIMNLLESDDKAIKSDVIQMFRRAGRADCLFGLAFSDDDAMVSRVKRYMEEQDAGNQENTKP